ncbi:MAG: ABC transporter permease [Chitinophagales bacterium]
MNFFYHFGKYILLLTSTFVKPEKFSMYWKESMRQMKLIGVGSFGIISVMALFIGAVTAIQFAYQLEDNIIPMWWIGLIVRNSMILELAPTLSCLLLAGKVGSNISSELGTMRISEQIDALEIMGVSTAGYLVGPKVLASLVVVPLLVVSAVFFGVYGGMVAGTLSGIYSQEEFIRGMQEPLDNYDIFIMYIKAVIFAFIITSISCYQGFYASGGALDIGASSTKAVVYSSISLIIANFLIAYLFL